MADPTIQEKLSALKDIFHEPRLRMIIGKKKSLVEDGNVYEKTIPESEYDLLVERIFQSEIHRKKLLMFLRVQPQTVQALSENTGIESTAIFRQLLILQQKGLVGVSHIDGDSPVYRSLEAG